MCRRRTRNTSSSVTDSCLLKPSLFLFSCFRMYKLRTSAAVRQTNHCLIERLFQNKVKERDESKMEWNWFPQSLRHTTPQLYRTTQNKPLEVWLLETRTFSYRIVTITQSFAYRSVDSKPLVEQFLYSEAGSALDTWHSHTFSRRLGKKVRST